MSISKLTYPYFVDNSTQLNATNLNAIVSKINEIIDSVSPSELLIKESTITNASDAAKYLTVNCTTEYAQYLGQTVKVKFTSSVNATLTPYAYGNNALPIHTYSNVELVANVESVVEMSIDETQGFYGFGGLVNKAGTYEVKVVKEL